MKTFLIILGFLLTFAAGLIVSQKYNFKVETKKDDVTSKIESTISIPTDEVQMTPTVKAEKNDEEMIKQVILENHSWNPEDVDITISTIENEYARGGIKEKLAISGGMFLAVKQSGEWKIVFEGNGAPDCIELKTDYLFPISMLSGICD